LTIGARARIAARRVAAALITGPRARQWREDTEVFVAALEALNDLKHMETSSWPVARNAP
jgi:hypothetical protein